MVTIKDIAKITGLSHTSVSRALNDHPKMKKETKERVLKVADELGYVTNINAKSLYTRKTYTIGLFFSTLFSSTSAGFFVEALQGAQTVVTDGTDYILSVQEISKFSNINPNYLKQRYDGILFMSQSDSDNEFIYAVKQANIPVVVLNRYFDDSETINVLSNDRIGVEDAIDYAVAMGHKEIGLIEGNPMFRSTNERRAGYMNALKKNNLQFNPNYVGIGDYSLESGSEAMEQILKNKEYPTLVYASNDDMAIGAISVCFKHGIRVPEDISFMGFDNMSFAEFITPPLTTVHRPIREIAATGADLLMKIINGEEVEKKRIYVDTHLIKRQSVIDLNVQ